MTSSFLETTHLLNGEEVRDVCPPVFHKVCVCVYVSVSSVCGEVCFRASLLSSRESPSGGVDHSDAHLLIGCMSSKLLYHRHHSYKYQSGFLNWSKLFNPPPEQTLNKLSRSFHHDIIFVLYKL